MKRFVVIIFVIFSSYIIKAQNEDDALRYSNITLQGTSKYLSLGGAMGAVGADISTLSSNPAGIGLFKSSLFTFTPAFSHDITKSDYLGNSNSDDKFNFALGNLGFIFASKNRHRNSDDGNNLTFQLGLAINRYNDFNNRVIINGNNSQSSLMTDWVHAANSDGYNVDNLNPYDTQLAYYTHLLSPVTSNGNLYTSSLLNGNVAQRLEANYSGSVNEPVITLGGNYNDKLYFGGSLGFPIVNYQESLDYFETNLNPGDSIKNYEVHTKQSDYGLGFNIKLGVIYRITDWIRVGAAVHSPTFYRLTRSFSRNVQSNLNDGSSYYAEATSPDFTYNLQTPSRYIASVAFIIKKRGMIDVDYEYADYSTMKFRNSSDSYDYSVENNNIQNSFTGQHTFRIGGEYKLDPIYIRAGYSFSTSPYKSDTKSTFLFLSSKTSDLLQNQNISAGIGFRHGNHFFDIGYMYSFYKNDLFLYDANFVTPSTNKISNQILSFTLGYRF